VNLITDSGRMAWDLVRMRVWRLQGRYAAPHLSPWLASVESGQPFI
jgi:hypothetical protein